MFYICPFHWATIPSQRRLLVVVVSMKCFCRLKSEYCSTTQNCLFKILSLSAKHWWSKSTQRAKYDFSRELEKTLSEESRRERESVCKISFLREEKENFFSKSRISRGEREFVLQNLDNREHLEKWTFNSPARDRKKWTISSRDFLEIENLVNACNNWCSCDGYLVSSVGAK